MTAKNTPSVGFLRPEATFAHIAARQHFEGRNATYVPMETAAICRAVQRGEIDYGVLPIENLFEGSVGATLDALYATADINVVGEIFLPIHHHLLSTGPLADIRRVYSHEQALNQSRNNLRRLGMELGFEIEQVREASTARGAQRAAAEGAGAAALANEMAAEVYGLPIVRRNMEDGKGNATRFLVFGRGAPPDPTGNDKTTFLFEVENLPGTLARALNVFAEHGLNATMIQSRPVNLDRTSELWEYSFFMEFLGHIHDRPMEEAYRILEKSRGRLCRRIRLLGSYPRGALNP
ncbi:MAG: ACT domain-containing protein [Chloroflexi bacterium]|nr:ACT domain-containing protein [Chloroflexota bacterium]